MSLREAIAAAATEPCLPVARAVLPPETWAGLPTDPALRLLGLWADTAQAHALLLDQATGFVLPVSTPIASGLYPALSSGWPSAAWFERMVRDLWGHSAFGAADARSWLDHGTWPQTQPLAARPGPAASAPEIPEFLAVEGDGLMQLAAGPVRGEIGEPAHLRVTAGDGPVLRAEARLGYAHRGCLLLMRGKSPRVAARFAARISGDATVAHAMAFAQAAELAAGTPAPPRAVALRAVMAELERITGHLDQIAVIAGRIGAGRLAASCALHGEHLRRAIAIAFGHRLMMDCVMPGGVTADIIPGGPEAVRTALRMLADALPGLAGAAASTCEALRGVGVIPPGLADRLALGGVAGRAAGRRFDARRFYAPYETLGFTPALRPEGDAAARCLLAAMEIRESLRLLQALLDDLPEGAVNAPLPPVSGEAIGCAESVRGDVWHWLRLDHGHIAAAFVRDPGWVLWPAAESALAGCTLEEVDLVRCSLALPSAGVDL